MINNQPALFLFPIVRIWVVVLVIIISVRVAKINQPTAGQGARRLHLPSCVDAVEKLGERDGAVPGARGSIFLVRAQVWRGGITTRGRRRRRRRVS